MGSEISCCAQRDGGEAEPMEDSDTVVMLDGRILPLSLYGQNVSVNDPKNDALFLIRVGSNIITKRQESREHFESEIEWSNASALDDSWALSKEIMANEYPKEDYRSSGIENLSAYFETEDFFEEESSEDEDAQPETEVPSGAEELLTMNTDVVGEAGDVPESTVGETAAISAGMEEEPGPTEAGGPTGPRTPNKSEESRTQPLPSPHEAVMLQDESPVPNVVCEEIIKAGLNTEGWELVQDIKKIGSKLFRAKVVRPGILAYKIEHIVEGKPAAVVEAMDNITERKLFDSTYKNSDSTFIDGMTKLIHYRYSSWLTSFDFVDFRRIWRNVPFDLHSKELDSPCFPEEIKTKSKKVIVLGFMDANGHPKAPAPERGFIRCHSKRPCGLIYQHWFLPNKTRVPMTKVTYFSTSESATLSPPQFVADSNSLAAVKSFKKALDKYMKKKNSKST